MSDMTFEEKNRILGEFDDMCILLADGYEDALVGYIDDYNGEIRAVYDRVKCIDILMNRDGMTEEEAIEWFEYNTLGAYDGRGNNPVYLTRFEDIV